MIYTKPIRIEFNHCDPAGIVFYPRYFEMFNSVIENFFADIIGLSFADIHKVPGGGTPLVNVQARFSQPTRLNEILDFTLEIIALGRSSLTVSIKAFHKAEQRLAADLVLVWMRDWKSDAWPAEIREKIIHFHQATA